jgi:hypothetical protein
LNLDSPPTKTWTEPAVLSAVLPTRGECSTLITLRLSFLFFYYINVIT